MRFNAALARRVALILGLSFPTFCNALADGRAVLPPKWMVDAYLSDALVKPSRDDIARAIIPGLGMVPAFLGGAGLAGFTWNPAAVTNLTLSGGDLVASPPANGVWGTRGTVSKNSGKWYFEVVVTTGFGSTTYVGLARSEHGLGTSGGLGVGDATSWGWNQNGTAFANEANTSDSYSAWSVGDNIGIAADFGTNTMYFRKNGTWQGSNNPSAGTGGFSVNAFGTAFPAIDGNSTSPRTVCTIQNPIIYALPTGYLQWTV